MEIDESARKYGVSDDDIRHSVEHAVVVADEDDTGIPRAGPAGNLLEIVTALRDDDTEIVIHAMRMRRTYEPLLGEIGEPNG